MTETTKRLEYTLVLDYRNEKGNTCKTKRVYGASEEMVEKFMEFTMVPKVDLKELALALQVSAEAADDNIIRRIRDVVHEELYGRGAPPTAEYESKEEVKIKQYKNPCNGDCNVCDKPQEQRKVDEPCKTRIAQGTNIQTPIEEAVSLGNNATGADACAELQPVMKQDATGKHARLKHGTHKLKSSTK